jgi:hypothetical protein
MGELDLAAIDWFGKRGRSMLGSRRFWVVEALECFGDLSRHGEGDCAIDIVPIYREGTFPVGCHLIFGCDDASQVFGMFSANI